jgi:putative hydrolase of the HAD superfamily
MTRIRAVCFDLDGTLLRDDHVHEVVRRAAREAADTHRLADDFAADAVRALEAYWFGIGESPLLSALPAGALPVDVWAAALRAHGEDDPAAAAAVYARQVTLEAEAARLYHESLDVLEAVRARGIRTAVITNGPSALQRGKLAAVSLDGFDAVIVSGEVGLSKPHAAIFDLALGALGVAPGEALHVGDNRVADVAGARDAGLTAVWIDRFQDGRTTDAAHHVIGDLTALLPLLDAP